MTQQMSLFNTSPQISGFKLDYMEIWNWGTFDEKIYRMNPQGNNSLLTGANASGKSTLIDALLTLMVPLKRRRFYNQSSGAEKKGDKSEETYFFGNYGQQQEGDYGSTSLRLRGKNSISVLLGSFINVDGRVVTLFQVRYFTGEDLKTIFGISSKPLTIAKHFGDFDSKGVWRKRLEREFNNGSTKRIIEFFDGPVAYEDKMLHLFGMRSEKALTLFNQIVGVKVLDDLDRFIRDNMLEELPAEEKYQDLKTNFQNLMEAKTNIEKTKEQIRQLEPIDAIAKDLQDIEKTINELQCEKDMAAYWFAVRTAELCLEQSSNCQTELLNFEDQITSLKARRKELDDQRSSLDVAIKEDAVGKQIKDLEQKIDQLMQQRDAKKTKTNKYNELARKVGLIEDPDESSFEANSKKSKEQKEALQLIIENEFSEKIRHIKNSLEEIETKRIECKKTVEYLLAHKNNISGRVAEIRDEILANIGATPEEIPFVGELISVRSDEQQWEFAIERILHNFALRLIVPNKYYRQVNKYVNSNNLRGRIVYQRYDGTDPLRDFTRRDIPENSLINKIDFKADSQYIEWIKDHLYAKFNYACVDTLEDFNHMDDKAATKEGLIKSTSGMHEKDDRPETRSRGNYVLGWDNRDKIARLRAEHEDLCTQEKAKKTDLNTVTAQKSDLEAFIEAYSDLSKYERFEDIDWQSHAKDIQEKEEQKKQLETANDRVKILQKQLSDVIKTLDEIDTQHDKIVGDKAVVNTKKDNVDKRYKENAEAVAMMESIDTDDFEANHAELLSISLESIDSKRSSLISGIDERIRRQKDLKSKKSGECKERIHDFKNPTEEITSRFRDWRSDVNSLTDSVEFVSEYQIFLSRLHNEDLPSFEGKFNRYLQETITNNVSAFRMFFQNWESSIRKTIEQLNSYLTDIDFKNHPNTYIQLIATKRQNQDVIEFHKLLEEAIPNLHEVESNIDGRRIHFQDHIEPLMLRLQDENWRKNVMDVRGWFTYKVVEYYKEDNQRCNTYESMGQLSGGEKAQLTYTILGSAIAYQFGLTKQGYDSSFRFIAIDEAFRAQDEDKARYLILLCKQLHLQLLVVTPSDNIHIVENDISYVHYVERKGNTSILCDMPISKFKEERNKFLNQDNDHSI